MKKCVEGDMSIPFIVALLALSTLMFIGFIYMSKFIGHINKIVDMLQNHQNRFELHRIRLEKLKGEVKYLLEKVKDMNK